MQITTHDVRKEDLEAIEELERNKVNDINLKEIETLLSNNENEIENEISTAATKTTNVIKNLDIKKINPSVKEEKVETIAEQNLVQPKTLKPETIKVEQKSQVGKTENATATKKILDSIIQHTIQMLGRNRGHVSQQLTGTKMAANQRNKTMFSSANINVGKVTEKPQDSSPVKANMDDNDKKAQSQRDSIVFSRLEAIAHNILRVLKEQGSVGSKLRYKINRDDLLKIRDFIKTTRDPKMERKIKVHSAKEALVAIKNLMKLIKTNKLGKVKTMDDIENSSNMDSGVSSKSKVPEHDQHLPEDGLAKTKNISGTSTDDKTESDRKKDKSISLEKLKELRITLLKDKLLKVLKMRDGDNLNLDLKRLKSKLEKQARKARRERRDVKGDEESDENDEQDKPVDEQDEESEKRGKEQEKPVDEQDKKSRQGDKGKQKEQEKTDTKEKKIRKNSAKQRKSMDKEKEYKKIKSRLNKSRYKTEKISQNVNKALRNTIKKQIKNLNSFMKKKDVEQATKRFQLIHGPKSFRKNLISLANLDANKMADEDLKKLHDKINEWIEVEEKLERETENGEVKDEISSGINKASDLLSSLQLVDVNGKTVYKNEDNNNNYENGNSKKHRQLEITIDVNKHGKKGDEPTISIEKNRNVNNQESKELQGNNNNFASPTGNQAAALGENKINDVVENSETPNTNGQVSNMYSAEGNPGYNGNPNQPEPNPAVTSKDNLNQARNMNNNEGNLGVINNGEVVNQGGPNPAVVNPPYNKYLKEMATAYMDGKAISENRNFGDKMKKIEETYEDNVNTMANNNGINSKNTENVAQKQYETFNNKNSPSGNQNGFKPEQVGQFDKMMTPQFQQTPQQNFGNENNAQLSNAYETDEQKTLKNDESVNTKEQFQQTSNSNPISSGEPGSNPQENAGTGNEKTGDFANNDEKNNGLNYNMQDHVVKGEQIANEDKIAESNRVVNGGQVAAGGHNAGQVSHEDQVTNEGQVAEGNRVSNAGQVTNAGILPNGHVITNVVDIANKQPEHENANFVSNSEQRQENINNAANQLANTMNEDKPDTITQAGSKVRGGNNVPGKNDQLKEFHHEKKPVVINTNYYDQNYDNTDDDEDEKGLVEKQPASRDRTPFLQSDKLKKLTKQHNLKTNNDESHFQEENSNQNLDSQTAKVNPTIQSKNSEGTFYGVDTPIMHRPGRLGTHRKIFDARFRHFRNRQGVKPFNSQKFGVKGTNNIALAQGNTRRIGNIWRKGNYHPNWLPEKSEHLSDRLSPRPHTVHAFSPSSFHLSGHTQGQGLRADYSKQQTPTPKSTYEGNVEEEDEMNSHGHQKDDMNGSILNGKEMNDEGSETRSNRQHNGHGGFVLNGKEINNDGSEMERDQTDEENDDGRKEDGAKINNEHETEHENPEDETVEENSSNDDSVNDLESNAPDRLHGKALLNNFLDQENAKKVQSQQGVPQGSHSVPHHAQSFPKETDEVESTDNLNEDIPDDQSSKATSSISHGSNTGSSNSQVLSAETDETDSGEEDLSGDEDSDVPQYSAKLIDNDDDGMQDNSNQEPSIKRTKHLHKHPQMRKGGYRIHQRRKNHKLPPYYARRHRYRPVAPIHTRKHRLRKISMNQPHKPASALIMKTRHNKQTQSIRKLQQVVNKKFTNQKTAGSLPQRRKPVNLATVSSFDAIIRGSMENVPTENIHIAKTQPQSRPALQASGTNAASISNGTATNDQLAQVLPKLHKVRMKLNQNLQENGKHQKAKFIEKQAPSNNQQSSPSVTSSGGGGGGGLETSGITIPGSQVAAPSLLGEDQMSNLNADDMMSSRNSAGNGMTSSSDVDRMASSTDPTDLTAYEHGADIAERTGAGDIVPVGMGTNSPSVTPVPNSLIGEQGSPTSEQSAPPEHVLFSSNGAKGEDLLKPLGNDPDGKLAALQDLRALTKQRKQQEESAGEDTDKISDPAFLEGMSNRISVSGAPLDPSAMTHTPSMPLRDIDQPDSTLVVPGMKLKRDEKGSSQEKNAQFTVDNKVVALGSGTGHQKLGTSPKTDAVQQLVQKTLRKFAGRAGQASVHGQAPVPSENHDVTASLAPRITQLVKEIVRESLGEGHVSSKEKTQSKDPSVSSVGTSGKEGDILLNSEKMETKTYNPKHPGGAGKESGTSSPVSPQSQKVTKDPKTSLFLPNVPPNPEGDNVFFDGEHESGDVASTMDMLSNSNLSNEEKIKLIKAYHDSQRTSLKTSVKNNPSKAEATPSSPEVEESKITEMLKSGKFNEHDLKSDVAGKEAAMQDMMLMEKQQDLDDKLSQAHLVASQASKEKQPGDGLPPGSQRENAMTLPGNLSPDITLPGNISPGASLPETMPAGISQPGNRLPSDVALPENRLPGTGPPGQMPAFQGQIPGSQNAGFSKVDPSMMTKETQMDKLLDQAQEGMPKGIQGENSGSYGLPKSGKVGSSPSCNIICTKPE